MPPSVFFVAERGGIRGTYFVADYVPIVEDQEKWIMSDEPNGFKVVFPISSMIIQPLDLDGNPIGPPIEMGNNVHTYPPPRQGKTFIIDELMEIRRRMEGIRPIIYYITNPYVPTHNEEGKITYYKIPTEVFAMDREEKDRIKYPTHIYVLHPENMPLLRHRAVEMNCGLEEYSWEKVTLRPETIELDREDFKSE